MTVVAVSGYFDPLHVGHLEYLEMAKQLGDKLMRFMVWSTLNATGLQMKSQNIEKVLVLKALFKGSREP